MSDNVSVLNTVWNNASNDYQTRIPQATRDNITAVGNAILNYDAAKNEFLDALVNRISLVIISSKMAKNKLSKFKKGMLEYGADIEEIFVSMANGQNYDVAKAETEIFKRELPNAQSMFHRVNREGMYKTTITDFQLKRAFLSNDGLGKLVSAIVNSLYSADTYDEYILMKQCVADYFTNVLHSKVIDTVKVTDENSAKAFFRTVKQASADFSFMSSDFNPAGVLQFSDPSEQVLLLHKNVNTYLDTEVLAWVFNRENINFTTDVVILDDFGTLADTQAVLCDRNFFMVFDKLFETRNQYNGQGLYTNYWLHHHQTLSTSQFHNAVAFKIPGA